jgi:hypothetical protein
LFNTVIKKNIIVEYIWVGEMCGGGATTGEHYAVVVEEKGSYKIWDLH